MTTYMKRSTNSLLIATLILLSNTTMAEAQIAAEPQPPDAVMCTMDVKECPDGSFVGRTGPTCEFVCPAGDGTSTDTTTDTTPTEVGEQDRDRLRDSDGAESVEARRAQFEENQEARQELRTDRRAALSEIRQQRIINLAANISNRMDIVVARLFSIVDRLESRILKLEQQNINTTEAKAALQTAAQSLAAAKSELSDIDVAVNQATLSDDPYTAWQALKGRYQSVASLIRSTHTSLRATVAALKVAPVETPSQTDSTNTQENVPTTNTNLLPTM